MPFKDYFADVICFGISAGFGYSFYVFLKSGEELLEALKVS